MPRVFIALYHKGIDKDVRSTRCHQYAEMPMNHLGYILEYHDVEQPLPNIVDRSDVAGVITCFNSVARPSDPQEYLDWALRAQEAGKKFVVLGASGFEGTKKKEGPSEKNVNRFWNNLGLESTNTWTTKTYASVIAYSDPMMMDFERSHAIIEDPYPDMRIISPEATTHLTAKSRGQAGSESVLVATSQSGAYAAEGHSVFHKWTGEREVRKWFLNLFEFFRLAADHDAIPKADVTTLCGRRMFYSHIDGDGWISRARVDKYKKISALNADVVYEEVLKPYRDLPCSVGPIAADVCLDWVGTKKSRATARKIFRLPNVEMANHTLSHPLDWAFFENYDPRDEEPYLPRYTHGAWKTKDWKDGLNQYMDVAFGEKPKTNAKYSGQKMKGKYRIPRAYANKVYDHNAEVHNAIECVNALGPPGKKVEIYLWSGNCQPYEAAVALTREHSVPNLNGGDSRFDVEYPSYAWVCPIGRQIGKQRQIFACNSNENTYTDLWMKRFYGFNRLPATFKNTESPVRLKAMNLYYHMYSGELTASLNALLNNVAYIRSQEIIPVEASRYAKTGDGFYTTQFEVLAPDTWKVVNRGELQTVRFDRSTFRSVDIATSTGVMGQRHHQGSLYVALDPTVDQPVIKLRSCNECTVEPADTHLYLVHSRWRVWDLERLSPTHVKAHASGYGDGEMVWRVPQIGRYRVSVRDALGVQHTSEMEVLGAELHLIAGKGAEQTPFEIEIEAI